jgi:signal transduction histidine kinase
MPFRVNARTILHLGSELISSDAVAFYELIKNAFDARSKRVDINVLIRMPHEAYLDIRAGLLEEQGKKHSKSQAINALQDVQQQFINAVNVGAPKGRILTRQVSEADSFDELLRLLDDANFIEINDLGEGMSFDDLDEVYLTIGTRSRLEEREEQLRQLEQGRLKGKKSFRPILGEKGVGRLSAMRLGNMLRVITSKRGERRWNVLEVDWSLFSHSSDELIEAIPVAPEYGEVKQDPAQSGTSILITALTTAWDKDRLQLIANDEFSKLTDPFDPESRYRIAPRFNGELITIPDFDETVFEQAHAIVDAEFSIDEEDEQTKQLRLSGKINYRYRHRRRGFHLDEDDLISTAGFNSNHTRPLISLGPFRVRFYWFNRGLLTAAEGVPNYTHVRKLVTQWAGGLMVYRDGFRVNPYGDPEDDWLDLDRKALASPGYKVNRRQIIGKVDISSILNPRLVDQTNREGLRDSEEKTALVNLLKYILQEFRAFLNEVDKKVQATEPLLDFTELDARVGKQERQAQLSLSRLVKAHAAFRKDEHVVAVQDALGGIRALIKQAKDLAESYTKDREQFVHLAGLGLMVEIIGHELTRATDHALATLSEARSEGLPKDVESLFRTLKTQLGTLQKRLRVLDPLSTSGRQRKTTFDLLAWVREILRTHEAQFRRHGITASFQTEPDRTDDALKINAVEGMIVQILENLISNSVYWLDRLKRRKPDFNPEISVTINTFAKEIYFTDNGPGIQPARREEIFQPFVTTKPAGEGKGLGLFISQEIARYNGAALYLSGEPTVHPDRLNTFIFALEAETK